MRNRKLLAAAAVALFIPAVPAAADPLEPGQVLHHVQVQVMAGDRNQEVEMTRSSVSFHRVIRDRDAGGKIVRDELVDARSGRMSTYDGRRDVRYDRVCKPVAAQMVAVMEAPGEAIDSKIASGDYAVVASRETLLGSPDWSMVWPRLAALAVLGVVMAAAATRTFGAYQRSL